MPRSPSLAVPSLHFVCCVHVGRRLGVDGTEEHGMQVGGATWAEVGSREGDIVGETGRHSHLQAQPHLATIRHTLPATHRTWRVERCWT